MFESFKEHAKIKHKHSDLSLSDDFYVNSYILYSQFDSSGKSGLGCKLVILIYIPV